jgi:hypothetical protein
MTTKCLVAPEPRGSQMIKMDEAVKAKVEKSLK